MKFPFVHAVVTLSLTIFPSLVEASDQSSTDSSVGLKATVLATRPESSRTDSSSQQRCVVQISTLLVEDMRLDDTLDLLLETGGIQIAGCQLKLAVAGSSIDIVDILPGELIDSCQWQMFNVRQITAQSQFEPREVWQITVMAQGFSSKERPVCFGFDRPAVLARLVLSSAHRPSVADTTAEIFFYWESCRDNSLSDRTGESLISDSVKDFLPAVHMTERDTFPTRHGLPLSCVSRSARNTPRRQVEFRNGGIEFRFKLDPPTADSSSSKK